MNRKSRKVLGIIVEYNPMHNGHIYHINEAKRILHPDYTIAIMSGNFTEQGNISCIDKFSKATIACSLGVDLVIELPTIFATSSSEDFAYGAAKILDSLGCVTHICFGSECADISILKSIAKKLSLKQEFVISQTKQALKQGNNVAGARSRVIKEMLTEEEFASTIQPNNILAIQYIQSLLLLNSKIQPVCILRKNSNFNDDNSTVCSTGIRLCLKNNSLELFKKDVPESVFKKLSEEYLTNDDFFSILKYEILSIKIEGLKKIRDIDLSLATRIYNNSLSSTDMECFIHSIKCKSYTMSRIKRCLINILLHITKEKSKQLKKANYARVLAVNSHVKADILSTLSKASIPIVSSISDKKIERFPSDVQESIQLDILSSNIYNAIKRSKYPECKLIGEYTNMI